LLDPQSAETRSLLARTLAARAMDGMTDTAAADLSHAEGLARRALAASWRSPLAHFANGHVLRAQGRPEEAIPEYETAIALNRNWVFAYVALGACKLLTGSIEEAIPLAEQAIRLSPRDPNIGIMYDRIGYVHLLQLRIDQAILWCEKARSANPAHPLYRAHLASAYALKGETERAVAELAEARRLTADGRYSSVADLRASQYLGVPKTRPSRKHLFGRPAQGRDGGEVRPPISVPVRAMPEGTEPIAAAPSLDFPDHFGGVFERVSAAPGEPHNS